MAVQFAAAYAVLAGALFGFTMLPQWTKADSVEKR
jgi:hypothetical protein